MQPSNTQFVFLCGIGVIILVKLSVRPSRHEESEDTLIAFAVTAVEDRWFITKTRSSGMPSCETVAGQGRAGG